MNTFFTQKSFKKLYWKYYLRKPFHTFKYERDQLFETLKKESTDIIFLGDSIIQHFELFEYLKDDRVRNRGIGGDTTQAVLQRVACMAKGTPLKCFIYVGINDVLGDLNPSEIFKNYREIVKMFKENSPQTKLYIMSVLPVPKTKDKVEGKISRNEVIFELNKQLKTICEINDCTYIDFKGHLFTASGMKNTYTIDGVHLNGAGYAVMAKLLLTYIKDEQQIPQEVIKMF